MPLGGDWLEIRSNARGVLETLGYEHDSPPGGATAHDGIFSVVVEDETKKTRALPSLYHGRAQIFAHRELAALGARLQRALQVIDAAKTDCAYMATACRVGDAYGIYTRDLFNRSSFRLHMSRLGVEFSEDPYVRLTPQGLFACSDWGEFEPRFMVAGGPFPADDESVEDKRGGLVPFTFGILRVGQITAEELAQLAKFVRHAPVLSSRSPRAIVETLKAA